MPNWLEKIVPPPSPAAKRNLPIEARARQILSSFSGTPGNGLPNASLIYGMAASALFVVALYFLFTGGWFTGFLVLLPAACFLGFALYFLKVGT